MSRVMPVARDATHVPMNRNTMRLEFAGGVTDKLTPFLNFQLRHEIEAPADNINSPGRALVLTPHSHQ